MIFNLNVYPQDKTWLSSYSERVTRAYLQAKGKKAPYEEMELWYSLPIVGEKKRYNFNLSQEDVIIFEKMFLTCTWSQTNMFKFPLEGLEGASEELLFLLKCFTMKNELTTAANNTMLTTSNMYSKIFWLDEQYPDSMTIKEVLDLI